MSASFVRLYSDIHACQLCRAELPLDPRPVLQVSNEARILIAGQAPGLKAHQSGIPFDDPSGDRLREWLGIDTNTFYNPELIALLPMGFCYPGRGKSGDLPPLARCATTWRQALLEQMPNVELTLVLGQYAQRWHLQTREKTLTATVGNWRAYGAGLIPLPHPSPRNNGWLKNNAWFTAELLPELQRRVALILNRAL
ncbi:MAG: uracil-DNA glycosylase family protein [Gammaproteobacteria bacterium]|nr:uracil-DNA glycosylase family protein [Gammaproteobacteria bacterium]MBQ0839424.1 uracil-DNA glycosylase family protein [Gammaproteobacteria bacterium]